MRAWAPALLGCWVLWESPALACRYNVRDVGFVEVTPAPYRLVVRLGAESPAGLATELRAAAATAFPDANVELRLVEPRSRPGDDETTRLFERHRLDTMSAAILVSPEGRSLPLSFTPTATTARAAAVSLVEGVVSSPLREKLLQAVVDSFAVVLVAEGNDPAQNRRAQAAAAGAIGELTQAMGRFPKAVKRPPEVVTITSAARQREGIFLWSVGLEEGDPKEPGVAVLYGRLRRIGDAFRGPLISQTEILKPLVILGQDCECDLDRSWMRGPTAPVRWSAETQTAVARQLGFDAESPMVRAEVGRILTRRPSASAGTLAALENADVGPLGYQETRVEAAGTSSSPGREPTTQPAPTETPASAVPALMRTNAAPASTILVVEVSRIPLALALVIVVGIIAVGLGIWLHGRAD